MKMLSSNEDILTTAAIKKTGAMLKIKNKQYTCAIADRMVTCGLNDSIYFLYSAAVAQARGIDYTRVGSVVTVTKRGQVVTKDRFSSHLGASS